MGDKKELAVSLFANSGASPSGSSKSESIRQSAGARAQSRAEKKRDDNTNNTKQTASPMAGIKDIGKIMMMVLKQNQQMNKFLSSMDSNMKSLAKKGPGAGSGPGGHTGSNGGGFNMGAISGALPVVGAIIGAVGFLAEKALEIGRASREAIARQAGTAGLAGIKAGDVSSGFQGEEVGKFAAQYIKGKGTLGNGSADQAQQAGLFNYARMFGQDLGQIGTQAGTFAQGGKGSGVEQFQNLASTAANAGITTDLPTVMSALADRMSDSIKEGFDNSDAAKVMVKQIATFQNGRMGSASSALEIVKALRSTQQAAGKGEIHNQFAFDTRQAAVDLIRKGDPEVHKYLENEGLITKGQDMSKMSASEMEVAARRVNESGNFDTTSEALKKHAGRFADTAQGRANFMLSMGNYGTQVSGKQAQSMFDIAHGRTEKPLSTSGLAGVTAQTKAGEVTGSLGIDVRQQNEVMGLNSEANAKAMATLRAGSEKVQTAMIDLAEKGMGLVDSGLSKLNAGFKELGDYLKEHPNLGKDMKDALESFLHPVDSLKKSIGL